MKISFILALITICCFIGGCTNSYQSCNFDCRDIYYKTHTYCGMVFYMNKTEEQLNTVCNNNEEKYCYEECKGVKND